MSTAPATIKVLIVEDEAAITMELEAHVAAMGHVVVGPTASCARALALAETERPDLALMDINIAGPRDGVETAAELRARFDIPVIFITAHTNPELVARAKPAQPLGWLVKPFNERELQVTIELAVYRNEAERSLRETNRQLQQALSEVKQLSGLLPICAWCRKIRDDRDYWHTVEEYLSSHSDVRFSHACCPDCYKAIRKAEGLENDPVPPFNT